MTTASPERAGMLGALLGNYRVLERLGEGGMGVVYVGRHEALGHRVVVKVLQPELSRDAEMVQRFFNEAQAAAAIRNLGIAQVFDFGTTADGRAYFVMELLEGESLRARLKQRRVGYLECCRIGRQIANVLQAAHACGITHRDLKPENLFLVRDSEAMGGERVKVLDFGIAKLASDAHTSGVRTRTGLLMGTPHYMSPEQCRGAGAVDARSDIYALGCILFEMTCGRPPFVGEGAGEIVGAHQYLEVPHPQRFAPDIPPALAALIVKMLAKPPGARPQAMSEVSQALDEIMLGFGAPGRAATQQPPPSASSTPPARPQAIRTARQAPPARDTTLRDPSGGANVQARTGPRPGARRLGIVFGSLVVASVIGTVIVVGARDDETASPSADAGAPDAARVVVETPDAAVVVPPPPPPAPDAAVGDTELELECLRYQSERKWGELDACAERLKATGAPAWREFKNRAVVETRAQARLAALETALKDKALKRAKAELDLIPKDATIYASAKQRYDEAEDAAIRELVAKLERVNRGDCKEYERLLQQERSAKPPRVAAEAGRQVPCKTQVGTTPPSSGCDPEALSDRAKNHYAAGQLAASLASYEAAYACKPDPNHAEKAFVISCNLGSVMKARLHWRRMTAAMKQRALAICERNNITEDMLNAP